ncbi:MAG: replication protein [Pyrinomonadaceae bacterium]|nr:replication protein [Pyrinomonadaceae bacterium]
MSEPKRWIGYADILEAKRKRDEREAQEPVATRQVVETSQVIETSQAIEARLVKEAETDRPETSQVIETSQVAETVQPTSTIHNPMVALPDVKGYTRFHHQIVDHLYPRLDAYEQVAHLHLYRLSWGYGKPICTISLQKLAERSGLSYKSAQRAVNKLEGRGLIRREGRIIGFGKEQGISFWVAPATSQATESRQPLKARQVRETNIKENNFFKENTPTKEPPPKKETEVASRRVGVGSRFSLEECRRYAEHLSKTGEGINNPGGYAMSIFQSGDADPLVEKFLHPLEEPKPIDTSACPDCGGTGMYYPDGPGRGVAKCRHVNLNRSE